MDKAKPLAVSYDEAEDVLTIDGKQYDGNLFRESQLLTPEGQWWRTIEGRSGVIAIQTTSTEAIKNGTIERP